MSLHDRVEKILLVDDDIDLLEQNKLLFESKGVHIITAESGEEGWLKFMEEKPDAVIVDLIMEQHDSGFVLCHKIKRTEEGKNTPVFILTSATYDTGFKFSASTEEEREWLKCDGIIDKPVVISEIISKLENFFAKLEK